jgi:hypothetical protein
MENQLLSCQPPASGSNPKGQLRPIVGFFLLLAALWCGLSNRLAGL